LPGATLGVSFVALRVDVEGLFDLLCLLCPGWSL
jgi:hypothetical protein